MSIILPHQPGQILTPEPAARRSVISELEQYAELEAELASLGTPEPARGMRDSSGRWTGPYIRFNQKLRSTEPDIVLADGRTSRYTSIAAAFPSDQAHTLILEFDVHEMSRVVLSDRMEVFAVGHLTNGMTLEAVGNRSAAIMFTAINYEDWRRAGSLTNRRDPSQPNSRNGSGKSALLSLYANVRMPAPNQRGRVRAVSRNYWMIQRERELAAQQRASQRPNHRAASKPVRG